MQFTYSFPSGFTFLYLVQLDATSGDNTYAPGSLNRVDSWSHRNRWKRVRGVKSSEVQTLTDVWQGLFGGSASMLLFKWLNLILCLAALATAGLGESSLLDRPDSIPDGISRYLWIRPLYQRCIPNSGSNFLWLCGTGLRIVFGTLAYGASTILSYLQILPQSLESMSKASGVSVQ